jgi:hypothetical protein
LSPEVAAYFEGEGLVSKVTGNKRTVSAAVPTPSPSVFSASSTNSVTSGSFSATYVTKVADSYLIPAVIQQGNL